MTIAKHELVQLISATIFESFDAYHHAFKAITQRASTGFIHRQWAKWQADSNERLMLHPTHVRKVVADLQTSLGAAVHEAQLWVAVKHRYGGLIANRHDAELAETFFNSCVRRILGTIGFREECEFVWFGATSFPVPPADTLYRIYANAASLTDTVVRILGDYQFDVPYADLEADAAQAARFIKQQLMLAWDSVEFDSIEMLKPVFYRNKGAYLVGRVRQRNRLLPMIFAVLHLDAGLIVDAVLLSENDASRVFSFTRAYFHVDVEYPAALVGFLKSLMPLKPTAELYTAIGYNKHGKTAFYRALYRHLGNTLDRFELARGAKGMVMTVFTLPSYDVVFKIIKDAFDYPKTTTRSDVIDHYHLVFKLDRVGRLIDAQEFEYLTFDRERFTPELLDELQQVASNTVIVEGERVIIKHLYSERRLYPLNLYLKEMGYVKAAAAVVDYGNTIADLAAANIFAGDLFTKNFGVTRHGRVVFYDYDELCLLTDCNFRELPAGGDYDEEMSDQPYSGVSNNDIFPEEFRHFLWLPAPLRTVFEQTHDYLFQAAWWREIQARIRSGEIIDIFPYAQGKRFRRNRGATDSGR